MTSQSHGIGEKYLAALIMADGNVFYGTSVGYTKPAIGEICFNTGLTGYQEVLSDPSYCDQIITFTFPHIGNIGANLDDMESFKPSAKGLIIREAVTPPSNYRQEQSLEAWLKKHKITGISGVDTRAITRHTRLNGAQNVMIFPYKAGEELPLAELKEKLNKAPIMQGRELTQHVATNEILEWNEPEWESKPSPSDYHVVTIDYGTKHNILRCLTTAGCKVTVVPSKTTAEEILKHKPDGIFLSNGPGDPAATMQFADETLKKLIQHDIPIFGICLGFQLIARALGCVTTKMHQGHRGANHPVHNLTTKRVEITSQNHGFVVVNNMLPEGVEVTHLSLFDHTIEGIKSTSHPVFAVQHHPEASPGPHDSHYLFKQFTDLMAAHKGGKR